MLLIQIAGDVITSSMVMDSYRWIIRKDVAVSQLDILRKEIGVSGYAANRRLLSLSFENLSS